MASKKTRKLLRSKKDHWIGGVCGGLGDYFETDPLVFRLFFIILAFFSLGTILLAYLVLWIVMPEK